VTDRRTIVVCEDGTDYTERFTRFLGREFRFVRAGHLDEARAACAAGVIGLLLDLDFRRTAREYLVDETGQPARAADAARLVAAQGIFLLQALRAGGISLPALLFADLDDPAQREFLTRRLAPLEVVPSSEGLPATAARLRRW
jgi:hypothetical protein